MDLKTFLNDIKHIHLDILKNLIVNFLKEDFSLEQEFSCYFEALQKF